MIDLEDVSAESPKTGRNHAKDAWLIWNGQPERYNAVIPFKFANHDRRKHPRVDIAATQDEADFLSLEVLWLRQHRRQAGGSRAFGHGLLQSQISIDRAFKLRLVHQNN